VSTIGLGLVFASFSMRKLLSLETEAAGHYREIG